MAAESTMKVDPDVKIPAAVAAAAKMSEDLYNQLRDTPAGEPEELTSQGNPEPEPAAAQQVAPQEPSQPKPVETAKPADAEPESWEHRYKSLHGRWVKQESVIKTLTDNVRSLEQVIATMSTAPRAPEPAQTVPELSAASLVTPEEINEYGSDLLDVVGRRARQEIEPELRRRDAEIDRLKSQLEGVNGFVQQDTRTKLMADMDARLPQWREINTNPDFMNWLSLPDPFSGGIRHDMLKAAYAQGNANRVHAFFQGFLAEEAAAAPVGQQPDAQTTTVAKVPLANLAAPGRAKSAAPHTSPAEKPLISRAEIAQFYADVAAGRYRNKDADKARVEKLIFDATKDGRVR